MDKVNYWIIHKDNGVSTIDGYGKKNPISTSYELLWDEIRNNENISLISLQNNMRRIIEYYFKLLGNKNNDTIIRCFSNSEEQIIAKSLIAWVNDGSHSIPDDIYINSYSDAIPKYKKVFERIFEANGHSAHYKMMMKIEDELD